MVLDDLKFLATINVKDNRIPRRLIPKIRKALKVFSVKDKRPKFFVQYGRFAVIGIAVDWLNTIHWIIEHYYVIQDMPKTSFGSFYEAAFCLSRIRIGNKYWAFVRGYDCDGFHIPPFHDRVIVDHAIIFVDGLIALKVETRNDKYFIADYFIGSMSPINANKITYLWYDHERDHSECI